MKKTFCFFIALTIICTIAISYVSADKESDIDSAYEVALAYVQKDSADYTIGEYIPSMYLQGLDINATTYDELTSIYISYCFPILDDGNQSGIIFVAKSDDGTMKVESGIYGSSSILESLYEHDFDQAMLLSDWGDFYYLLKNGDSEVVVPGEFTYGSTQFKNGLSECTVKEFFNALEYRNKYDPIDPRLMGGKGEKAIFNYIGMSESRQVKMVIVISSILGILLFSSIITIVKINKKRNAISNKV